MSKKEVFTASRGGTTRRRQKAKPYFPPSRHRVESHSRFEDRSLPLSSRADELLRERLSYALRHPHSSQSILIDIDSARALLSRLTDGG